MAFSILGTPKPQFFGNDQDFLGGGLLYTYDPATDIPKATYPTADDADAATNANTNPIILNSRGEPPTGYWGVNDARYKIVITNSSGTQLWAVDDIRVPSRDVYDEVAQTLTDAGAVSITTAITHIVTTVASALTLADGEEGQRKFIVMKTDGGTATLTPTSLASGATIVFDDVGDSADLLFTNGSWHWQGGTATLTGVPGTAVTFTSADATPTVAVGSAFITAGTTAITDFDDGVVGQTINILAASSITITDSAAIALKGSINFDMLAGDSLTLHMFNDQVWEEVGRSTTSTAATEAANMSEIVSATNVITAAETGKTFFLNLVGGFASTLPVPAVGLYYKFIVSTAPTTAYTVGTDSGADIFYGTINEITATAGVSIIAQDVVNFVASTSLVGDWIEVISDGTNWYVNGSTQVDGGITASAT